MLDIISGPNRSDLLSACINERKILFLISGTDMVARVEIFIDGLSLIAGSESAYAFEGHTPVAEMKVKGRYDASRWDNKDMKRSAGEIEYLPDSVRTEG
jgi:hypothetical protein